MVEHYVDGDLVNEETPVGYLSAGDESLAVWGMVKIQLLDVRILICCRSRCPQGIPRLSIDMFKFPNQICDTIRVIVFCLATVEVFDLNLSVLLKPNSIIVTISTSLRSSTCLL